MEERNALLAEVSTHLSICLSLCMCIDPVLSFLLVIPAKMPHLLAGEVLYVWVHVYSMLCVDSVLSRCPIFCQLPAKMPHLSADGVVCVHVCVCVDSV